jgi:hypothetical protein
VSQRLRFLPTALLLVGLYGAAQLLFGERIPVTDGLGTYDGRRYGEIAKDPRREIVEEGLDLFRLQRVLPSLLAHAALRLLGSPVDTPHVIAAFLLGNWLLQLLLVLIWDATARELALPDRAKWLGLCLLFLNFANLKQPYFLPVLTDTPALVLGAALLYLHLTARTGATLLALLAAAFTWPALFVSGSLLWIFERRPLERRPPQGRVLAAAAVGGVLAVFALHAWFLGVPRDTAAVASLTLLALYVFLVVSGMLSSASLFEVGTYRGALRPRRLVAALVLFVGLRFALESVSTAPGMTFSRHLRHLVLYNSDRPGLFLLAHAVYFGPVVLLLLLLWPEAWRAAHRLGLGVTAFTTLQLAHGINAESRQLVDALPLLALLATLAAEASGWTAGRTWIVAALGLLGSKAWLAINQGQWGDAFAFPAQYYFMNIGPSMNAATFRLQAAAVLLSLGLLGFLVRRPRTQALR